MLRRIVDGRLWLVAVLALVAGLGAALLADRAAHPAAARGDSASAQVKQLRVNQRISQVGLRRANRALLLLGPVRPADGAPGWPTESLRNGAVTGAKLATAAVGSAHLADGAVTETAIAEGAVGESRLAPAVRAAIARPPFVVLNADGSLATGPDGFSRMSRVVSAERKSTGSYLVSFAADTRACALVATVVPTKAAGGDVGRIAVTETDDLVRMADGAGTPQVWTTVSVLTRKGDGTPADRAFHLAAIC